MQSIRISKEAGYGEIRGRLVQFISQHQRSNLLARDLGSEIEVFIRPSGMRSLASKYTVGRKDYKDCKREAAALLRSHGLLSQESTNKKSIRNMKVREAMEEQKCMVIVEKDAIYRYQNIHSVVGHSGGVERRPIHTAGKIRGADSGFVVDNGFVVKSLPDSESGMREIETFKLLGTEENKNIVRYHGYSYTGNELRVVMENCQNGSVGDLQGKIDAAVLEGKISSFEGDQMRLLITQDALSALAQMKAKGVTHRDFRPANLLIAEDWTVKASDFGTADKRTRLDMDVESDDMQFRSPEFVRGMNEIRQAKENRRKMIRMIKDGALKPANEGGGVYTRADLDAIKIPNVPMSPSSDIWSFGVCVHKFFYTDDVPFENVGAGKGGLLAEEIASFSGRKIKFPDGRTGAPDVEVKLRAAVQDMIRECMRQAPGHRKTPRELLKSPVWAYIGTDKEKQALRHKMSSLFGGAS